MAKVSLDAKWHELTLGCVIPNPGSAAVNFTGSWRSSRPVWDEKRCIRCGVCDMFCPDAAIAVTDGKYGANLDYCKGCGICSRECPTGAIIMITEEV